MVRVPLRGGGGGEYYMFSIILWSIIEENPTNNILSKNKYWSGQSSFTWHSSPDVARMLRKSKPISHHYSFVFEFHCWVAGGQSVQTYMKCLWRTACSRGSQGENSNEESQDFEHACDECHCYESGTAQISVMPAYRRKMGLRGWSKTLQPTKASADQGSVGTSVVKQFSLISEGEVSLLLVSFKCTFPLPVITWSGTPYNSSITSSCFKILRKS